MIPWWGWTLVALSGWLSLNAYYIHHFGLGALLVEIIREKF